MLRKISPENKHALKAALGWLELEQFDEATKEVSKIDSQFQNTPEILNLRWQILSKSRDWEEALLIAREFVHQHPQTSTAWIHLSYTLHELNRTLEARDHLLNAREKFPHNPLIVYNLACYSCQLKDTEVAMQWIQEAMALKEKAEILRMALEDKDLEPLHERLSELV